MQLSLIGINHKTAPIGTREHFYLSSIQQDLLLSELKCLPEVFEACVVSTCNRTELYIHHSAEDTNLRKYLEMMTTIKELKMPARIEESFYQLHGREAVEHLLRVTCGLDSLVIGEKQILGQMKRCFEKAQSKGMFSRHFNILSSVAIRAGKKAHTETMISSGGSSVSWAAITTAEKELGTLEGRSLLIIGAGKMSELAVGQIIQKKFDKLYLINRTQENAEKLAEKYGATAVPFCDIKDIFPQIDVCICASDAPHYILDHALVEKARKTSPNDKTVLIDISMPRNIDPRASLVPGVHLYHIDDLNQPIEEAMKTRKAAVINVENIINRKVNDYYRKVEKSEAFHDDLSDETVLNLS